MKKMKLFIVIVLVATNLSSFAQMPEHSASPKLIAVVNTANWCAVCKANGARFGSVLMPYVAKSVNIYRNDITNDSTKAVSNLILQNAGVYAAVTTVPRKGMGKMLKSCGLVKDKKLLSAVAGIVTFINPKTHKQVKQISIAETDAVMIKTINKLLN